MSTALASYNAAIAPPAPQVVIMKSMWLYYRRVSQHMWSKSRCSAV